MTVLAVAGGLLAAMLLVGLALVVIGTAAWLYLARPWTQYDDLTTPYYTGHEDHTAEAVAEAVAEAPAEPLDALPPTEPNLVSHGSV